MPASTKGCSAAGPSPNTGTKSVPGGAVTTHFQRGRRHETPRQITAVPWQGWDPWTWVQLLRTSRALDLQLLALPRRFQAAGYSSPPPLSCPTPLSPPQETPGPLHPPAQHAPKFPLCPASASTRWPRPAATPSPQPQAPPRAWEGRAPQPLPNRPLQLTLNLTAPQSCSQELLK